MKKYNELIILSLLVYIILSVCMGIILKYGHEQNRQYYKVEINRIMSDIKASDNMDKLYPEKMDLSECQEIQSVSYLPANVTDKDIVSDFYTEKNNTAVTIMPLMDSEKDIILGYLRFERQLSQADTRGVFWAEGALFLLELNLMFILFYLKKHLIQPFHRMQDMTYELSRGNLHSEVKAEKNQYLGKFLWGLNELKDELNISRKRELELQREKKLLLLSLSHDIKTPLNMIKLYVKALQDGICAAESEKAKAYHGIGEKAAQIENYVSQIVKASKEDIIHIDVEKGEFYLKELMQRIETVYGEKCALRKCSLTIEKYQNRIFQGDINRLFEVFENIFANAFKYGDGRQIKISFYEEDYCQLIRVFNTGETVSDREFVHLFDSFFRGENTRGQQGSGLGLYICKEIMHKMGGEIFAECEQDGMAFVVVLEM